ncbi:hypothetical protein WL1483_2354 [Aeromonas schubertii]|uniref:Uncharacterized protein n=2 Tax=Aeromonas schubertii TaxID=652 RepID=A0A0S2SJA5_9GAMM|nr:hypothetical protein WL1483_2354 [Aeromonas schubertii]
MEAPASVIQARVQKRSGIVWSKAYIDELIASEKKAVEGIAENLNVDLLKITNQVSNELIWDDYGWIVEKKLE